MIWPRPSAPHLGQTMEFKDLTPDQREAYDLGYVDGKLSAHADWIFAFDEFLDLGVKGPMDAVGKVRDLLCTCGLRG